MANTFPVRSLNGQWQVLMFDTQNFWLNCGSEKDARLVASAMLLAGNAMDGIEIGEPAAAKIEAALAALQRNHPGDSMATRYLRTAARIAREKN